MKIISDNHKPSQQQIDKLLKYYQAKQYADAERLSLSITQEFSEHPFGWKVLGVVLEHIGKIDKSLLAHKTSIRLGPHDAEAHYHLGNTLKKLKRLKEAEASFKQAIVLKPDFVEAHNNLGNTMKQLGRFEEAEKIYRYAIVLKPDLAEIHNNLASALKELGRLDEAKNSYKQAISLKSNLADAYANLGSILRDQGEIKEAENNYKKAIEIKKDSEKFKHTMAALIGKTTNFAPREYVEDLFDDYAINFENSLINKLEYKIPNKITEILIAKHRNVQLGSVLDLGCGTGLMGNKIKKYCSNLEGIDLSKQMLKIARVKNVYNKLDYRDIIEYLETEDLNFNCFISTDTFIYVGELSKIFQLIKSRNKSKGKFIFTTEHSEKDRFFLETSGRYSHSKKYIETLCEEFGYNLSHFETTNLRRHKDAFITGGLYFLDF